MLKARTSVDCKRNDAVIEDVKIYSVYDRWIRIPGWSNFCNTDITDIVLVTAKTKDGRKITDKFYVCLKPSSMFTSTSDKRIHIRRERFISFLRYYNITERIEGWKGKRVEVVTDGGGCIFVPPVLS